MARLLVRLRLRLLGNSLHLRPQQALGMVFGSLFGLLAALVTAAMLVGASTDRGWEDVVPTFLAVLWVAWIVIPAISFSTDTTLDPRRFATFPLTARQLVPGLLLAAMVGIGPAASLLATGGIVIGAARLSGSATVVVVALVSMIGAVLVCVAWSRALLAVASDLLTSRRGREIAGLVAMVTMVAIVFGPQLLTGVALRPDRGQLSVVASVAAWTPAGMGGAAVVDAVDGALGVALLRLAGVAASILVALVIWAQAITRTQRVAPTRAATTRATTSLYPRLLTPLPHNRTTAVAVRFLRTLTRDTRVRMQALSLTFLMVPLFAFSASAIPGPTAPLYASYLVIPFGLIASNQYGLDGPPLWQHAVAGSRPAEDLLGRNLPLALIGLPLAALGSVVLAVSFDAWATVPAALLLSLAVLLVLLGVSNTAAALAPYPIPEDPSNIFSGGTSGSGFVQGILVLVVMLVHGALLLPVMLPVMLITHPMVRTIAAASGAAYGIAVFVAGTLLGAARARSREPELLEAIDPRGG